MTIRSLYVVPAALLLLFATHAARAGTKERVNAFYGEAVGILQKRDAPASALGDLVGRNSATAKDCVAAIEEKLKSKGEKREFLEYLREKLQESLLLATSAPGCSGDLRDRLERLADKKLEGLKTRDEELQDVIFALEGVIRLCPDHRKKYHFRLADLYLKERQFGMAVNAYREGLKLKEDEDARKLLDVAIRLMEAYKLGKSVTGDEVRKLFREPLMSPVPGSFGRKVEMKNTIQLNNILFDEWSFAVKPESLEQLKTMGPALKDAFSSGAGVGLMIEGHTDRRGDPERNNRLSEQRAEAVKDYLVENFGLDGSRVFTRGYGPGKPFSPEESEEGWALNRRVEFSRLEKAEGEE
ncbi:MAG: OmpA family protein [Pseudomonadota bacterium]